MQRLKIDLELREASITWQQKALQLQMNPHFIFNVLNSIKGLIAEQNSKAARNQIQNFSNFLRGMLDHSRSESISLQEEIKFLKQYLQLEQSMQSHAFEYIFEVEDSLLKMNPNIPPMMTQVFIENAIKHGFKNIEHQGILSIIADLFGQNVRFRIQDNGQGRTNALASKKTHKSHAIHVIEDRLKTLAPDTKIERVKIADLTDENGMAKGTLVILILPILKENEY
jgi:LytS/YehU family sensor histidine kinase